jgi:hypothetical protein
MPHLYLLLTPHYSLLTRLVPYRPLDEDEMGVVRLQLRNQRANLSLK